MDFHLVIDDFLGVLLSKERDKILEPGTQVIDEVQPRPSSLAEFVGQEEVKTLLGISITSAKARGEAIDHILLSGPPGLGKTTIAKIVATELGTGFSSVMGPSIAKPGDLASVLVGISAGDILFIDEIHRLPTAAAELIYGAMEDFELAVVVDRGGRSEAVKIPLPRFTLVGATTRPGVLPHPFRDRFGLHLQLSLYTPEELEGVVRHVLRSIGVTFTPMAIRVVSERSRGTPRIAGRLVRRIRDFAISTGTIEVDEVLAGEALEMLGVDVDGLDRLDRRYLDVLATRFKGGPAGLEAIAAALGEDRDSIEGAVEPYLVQKGFVVRTPRGRSLSDQLKRKMVWMRPFRKESRDPVT
jgi:Holliday junction DNA helicase RuvB